MSATANVWSGIKRLAVVVQFDSIQGITEWRDSLKNLGLNIHDCRIIAIVESKKTRLSLNEVSSVIYLAEGDFNFLGSLKNEDAKRALSDRYDAILIVKDHPNKIAKAVQKVNATIDIGLNSTSDARMINLQTEEFAPKYMLNFVKQTLEKIT
jgi:hypothetical protein